MSESPEGWTTTRLAEIVATRKGKKPDVLRQDKAGGFIPYLDIQAIENNCIRQYADVESSRLGKTDDLFVVWDGARSGWVGLGQEGAIGSTIMALESLVGESRYLYYFIKTSFDYINSNARGTGIPHVDPEIFGDLEVPLPPLNEQHRIVLKLEKLLSRVDATQLRLATIPRILKRFRQSVLAAACSGRLTADWRAENRNPEPYPVEAEPYSEDDQDCPSNWRVTRLGTLTELVTSGSRGWAKYYSDSGSIFIRAQNINADILNLEDIAFVKLPSRAEGLRTRVSQHDLLVTITGANVTKSALVEKPTGDAYVSQHVALVRLADSRLSKFLFCSVISPTHGRKQLQTAAYGQGKPGLNLDNIRDLVVVLPPLAEQQEIVRRVEALFKTADALEARYRTAKAYVDKLTQSILAKAFRGELVPQDPNDEPASFLLQRLARTRTGVGEKKRSRKR